MPTLFCLKPRSLLFLAASALLVGVTTGRAQPTSGAFGFDVFGSTASTINPDGLTASDSSIQNWVTTPTTLNASASAFTGSDGNGYYADVYANGTATWAADGNSGTIQATWGWNSVGASQVDDNSLALDAYDAIDNWTYTFTAQVTGQFIMDYNIGADESESTFGLQGWAMDLNNFDSSSNPPQLNAIDPTESGVFVGNITAGNTYNVSLDEQGNLSEVNADNQLVNGGTWTEQGTATFDWSIVASSPQNGVPDGGYALGLLGAAFVGLAGMRRERRMRLP